MKVFRVELMVLDFEGMGEDGIRWELENVKYAYPSILSIESREIGEWDDGHPLNKRDLWKKEMQRLFGEGHDETNLRNFKENQMNDPRIEELLQVLKKLRKQYDECQSLKPTMVEVDALIERYADADVEKVEDPVKTAIEETSKEWAEALTSLIDFLGGDGPSLWNWCGETPTPDKIVAYLKEHVKYLEELAADSELNACCDYLGTNGEYIYRDGLRRFRRPQPTLKSQALKDLETVRKNSDVLPEILDTIEKALQSVPETDH